MSNAEWPRPNLNRDQMPWARRVMDELRDLRKGAERREQGEQNGSKGRASSFSKLADTVQALPIPQASFTRVNGFGLTTTQTVSLSLTVPAGKTKVAATVIGNVSALDKTSGGFAVAYARIETILGGGTFTSPTVSASKDAGASIVANNITPALGFQQVGLTPGSSFNISMYLTASNPSAFTADATNFATLSVTAIFFD